MLWNLVPTVFWKNVCIFCFCWIMTRIYFKFGKSLEKEYEIQLKPRPYKISRFTLGLDNQKQEGSIYNWKIFSMKNKFYNLFPVLGWCPILFSRTNNSSTWPTGIWRERERESNMQRFSNCVNVAALECGRINSSLGDN